MDFGPVSKMVPSWARNIPWPFVTEVCIHISFCVLLLLCAWEVFFFFPNYSIANSLQLNRYEKEGKPSELADIDVFVSTVDPMKEPPLITANTVLSILAVDYPVEKVACYVSDDGAAMLTFEALSETSEFARKWVPFCKKFSIEPRAPEWYFAQKVDYLKDKVDGAFIRERRAIKVWTCSYYGFAFLHICSLKTNCIWCFQSCWRRESMKSSKFGLMHWLQWHRRFLRMAGQCRMGLHGPETMSEIILEWFRWVPLCDINYGLQSRLWKCCVCLDFG